MEKEFNFFKPYNHIHILNQYEQNIKNMVIRFSDSDQYSLLRFKEK